MKQKRTLGDILIDNRFYVVIAMVVLTIFFLYMSITRMTVKTIFSDLLPQNHAYINLHKEVRDKFGGANEVYVMVQVRDKEDGGQYKDIFNPETLTIVKNIEEEMLLVPGVDRNKIFSLASRRLKDFKVNASGFAYKEVMFPDVPKTPEGLEDLRKTVYGSPICYPGVVSFDAKKTLITADFFEDQLDYDVVFKKLHEMRKKYENNNNIVAISGEPMHLGYVSSYTSDVLKILGYTLVAMLALFFMFFRSKRGMIMPIVAGVMSAIWGMGFLSLAHFNLDPLVLVFPFLIGAMAASHTVQVVKRYEEEAFITGDGRQACKNTVNALLAPGFASIITDSAGIFIIALVPIPVLYKIGLSCAFWAFITVLVAFGFIPVLFSYMPLRVAKPGASRLDRVMRNIARWICGWGKYLVLAVAVLLTIWGATFFNKITVGSAIPGSEILWPWHRYNVDSFRIAFAMPRLSPLFIIAQGDEAQAVGGNPELWRDVNELTRYLQKLPGMRVITVLTCLTSIPQRNRSTINNNPNWYFNPANDDHLKLFYKGAVLNVPPGTMDKYIDTDEQAMNIIVLCRDKTTEGIKIVMDRVREFIAQKSKFGVRQQDVERHGIDKIIYALHTTLFAKPPEKLTEKPPVPGMPKAYYRLAAGAVGVQAAIDECLEVYSLWTFIFSMLICYLLVVGVFRSWICGFVCMLPIFISNALAFAVQCLSSPPIALTTATLPVASIGIGLGVDYGIYYVSRVIEEVRDHNRPLNDAIIESMASTGKAILYIGITLCAGIVFWFFSKMMFQAMMGFMLAIVLFVNMIGALTIIPAYIAIFKPGFIVNAAKKS